MSTCCGPSREAPLEVTSVTAESPPAGGRPHTSAHWRTLKDLAAAASQQLNMVGLTGGTFRMGSQGPEAYPEDGEGPVRDVRLAPFAVAATTVSVAEFAAFVLQTGHQTDAEAHGTSLVFAGLLPQSLYQHTPAVADAPWWRQVEGATWLAPEGPGSTAADRADHPVTHVSQRDALGYAHWVGARLLHEAEWEFAARGGLDQQPYPWGSVREPEGRPRMNTFSGQFPHAPAGAVGTMPVSSYPPNAYGLHNMTGNVWEWTASRFRRAGGAPVLRGGSYMCHASYCRRYRTSARTAASADTSLGHTGFRLGLSTG